MVVRGWTVGLLWSMSGGFICLFALLICSGCVGKSRATTSGDFRDFGDVYDEQRDEVVDQVRNCSSAGSVSGAWLAWSVAAEGAQHDAHVRAESLLSDKGQACVLEQDGSKVSYPSG